MPAPRDLASLIETDAANSQATYTSPFSPDSNNHPDCDQLFSALDTRDHHAAVSEKPSNGSDEVFLDIKQGNTVRTNLNDKVGPRKVRDRESLELSDSEELVVRFSKSCIVGTETTKRNSIVMDKELTKTMPDFVPSRESDSELTSDQDTSVASNSSNSSGVSRIDKIKQRAARLRLGKENSRTELDRSRVSSEERSRTASPERPESARMFSGRAFKTSSPRATPDLDDGTLKRDDRTLTRNQSTSSLIRDRSTSSLVSSKSFSSGSSARTLPRDSEEAVMRPVRERNSAGKPDQSMKPDKTPMASPGTLTKNRQHRFATKSRIYFYRS